MLVIYKPLILFYGFFFSFFLQQLEQAKIFNKISYSGLKTGLNKTAEKIFKILNSSSLGVGEVSKLFGNNPRGNNQ